MKPLSVFIGSRKEGISAAVEPVPAPQEPKEEPYPNNVMDILTRLREVAVNQRRNRFELEREGELARDMLLEISLEGINAFKEKAESSGKRWEGRLDLHGSSIDQDGFYSHSTEGAVVSKSGTILFFETTRRTAGFTETQIVHSKTNNNCTRIFWAEFIESREIDSQKMTTERLRIDFKGNTLRKLSFMQMDGQLSLYDKPQGPIREFKIQLMS